jgi:hypothetical protein
MNGLRLLYLARMHEENGRDALAGRLFVDSLVAEGVDVITRHAVMPAEYFVKAPESYWSDVLSIDEFDDFAPHCVFAETGLVTQVLRFPSDCLERYVRAGGVLIVEGLSKAYIQDADPLSEASTNERSLLRLRFANGERTGGLGTPYMIDEISNSGHASNIVCHPQHIVTTDWLMPTFDGIDQLVVVGAVPLYPGVGMADTLATAEQTAQALVLDELLDFGKPYIWAQVRQLGNGYVATLAGDVVADALVDSNPDNALWLHKLVVHLVDSAKREASRKGDLRSSSKREASAANKERPSTEELLGRQESLHLEFKETARVDTKSGEVKDFVEHAVLKTVAAFLNTDGGTLLIGVHDTNGVMGLEDDFNSFSDVADDDKFIRTLTQKFQQALDKLAVMNVLIEIEEIDGRKICRVDVTPHTELVYLTHAKDKAKNQKDVDAVYIRSNNTTVGLAPREIADLSRQRPR